MNINKTAVAGIMLATALAAGATVNDDFRSRRDSVKSVAMHTEIFDRDLTPEQRSALEFLYAYMPLPDVTDYSGEFFIRRIRLLLPARKCLGERLCLTMSSIILCFRCV